MSLRNSVILQDVIQPARQPPYCVLFLQVKMAVAIEHNNSILEDSICVPFMLNYLSNKDFKLVATDHGSSTPCTAEPVNGLSISVYSSER